MPKHDLGYRGWPGKYSSDLVRFKTIAVTGIKIVGRNKWVRRTLLMAWLPTLYWAGAFFAYERMAASQSIPGDRELRNTMVANSAEGIENILGTEETDIVLRALTATDPREGRHLAWVWLLSGFLRLPQAIAVMLVIGMIAPPLIARDVRSKAFLMYFSKPINRYEYVLGKMCVVGTYVVFITTIPALGCYVLGVGLSNDLGVIFYTWDIPIRIVLASLAFVIPAVSVSLMFSSLTNESRFAAFAWFAMWLLGFVAWKVIFTNVPVSIASQQSRIEHRRLEEIHQRENSDEDRETSAGDSRSVVPAPQDAVPDRIRSSNPGHNPAEQDSDSTQPDGGNSQRGPPVEVDLGDDTRILQSGDNQVVIINGQVVYAGPSSSADQQRMQQVGRRFQDVYHEEQAKLRRSGLSLISMYDTLVCVQRWIFGLETGFWEVFPSILMSIVVTLFSWFVLLKRVAAPIRV